MTVVPRPSAPWLIHPAKLPATSPPPLVGPWAPTDTGLDAVDILHLPNGRGPEDVVVDPHGRIVTGTDDGRIWRFPAGARPGAMPEPLANTGGRPLGIEIDPREGTLIVCDAYRGLLRLTDDGTLTELTRSVDTRSVDASPILLCNNAAVARDGVVYFTDSSNRFPLSHWRRDLLEHRPNGRVLAYDPTPGTTDIVATGFHFPNGIALTPSQSALLLCETVAHRLIRLSLPDATVTDLGDLPAYPDNMSPVGDGTYWIALASPRVPIAEKLLPHPGIRRLAAILPTRLQPQPRPYSIVALIDEHSQVLRTIHGPAGKYVMVTGVRQHGSSLWLGSLTERAIAHLSL